MWCFAFWRFKTLCIPQFLLCHSYKVEFHYYWSNHSNWILFYIYTLCWWNTLIKSNSFIFMFPLVNYFTHLNNYLMIITIFVKTQYIEYVFTFNNSLNTLYSSNTRCSSYFAELRHDLYVIRNRMTFTYYHITLNLNNGFIH